MLFLVGLPGLFLEQSVGQYGRVAINKVGSFGVKVTPYLVRCRHLKDVNPLDIRSNGPHLPRPGVRHVGLQLHERRLLRRHPRLVHLLPRHGVHLDSSMGHSIHDNL